MPAKRPRRTHRFGAIGLFALLSLSLVLGFLTPPVRGDLPIEMENNDASRIVTWTMGTTAGLTLQGVGLEGANATLPWKPFDLSWGRPSQFAANGSVDPNLVVNSADISLRADAANHVTDGDFAAATPWTFETSAGGNVSAAWDGGNRTAVFRHNSPSRESQWDSLDAYAGMWAGINGLPWRNTTRPHEGSGMLGLNFTLGPGPGSWAGVQRLTITNWSGVDRMVIWVLPLNASLPLSFNVTAYVGAVLQGSTARTLVPGWQEISVDLTELGSARDSLISLTLRVNGQDIPSGTVYFDDLRVGNAKRFDEVALARQTVVKANATAASLGSATLRLNWSASSAIGVVRTIGVVNVTGPSGSSLRTFAASPGTGWRTFMADVSDTTGPQGLYEVSVGIQILADNTSASTVEVRLDDVSIFFPNRHNGTYLSGAVPLGAASEFLQVNWSFDASGPTGVQASLRGGNDSSPGSATWGPWRGWTAAGSYPPGLVSATHVQIRVDLTTTNASASPSLRGLVLETRHRSMQAGSIASGAFTIPPAEVAPFLHWRTLLPKSRTPPGTSIAFSIGDGSYWRSVSPGSDLSGTDWTTIRWSATLTTTDGLVTPSLERVDLIYEYLGPTIRVELWWPGWPAEISLPAGGVINFTAKALDAGSHLVSSAPGRFDWMTTDSQGQVRDGLYQAGEPGDRMVTATLVGTSLSATVRVTVVPSGSWIDSMIRYSPYGVTFVAIAAIGYVGYQYGIRRMFKIDDIFLISKDGRLLMHNTRRMRADRDEDILSGMLTAIQAFLHDSDPEENGELKRFEIGGRTTLLERGSHAYLAAVYSGRVPRWAGKDLKRFMSNLESNFGQAFARWSGDPDDLQGLKEFTGHFVSRFRYRPQRRVNGRAG